MERRSPFTAFVVFGGLLGLCFFFTLALFKALEASPAESYGWSRGRGPRVGVVEIKGVIADSKEFLSQLVELRRDPTIKAIVVRIDSPGGAVAPSQEMFRAVQRARRDKKVVASMGTLAASGGYYVAAAADRIIASPGTITGSIGVISQFPDLSGLLELARLRETTIKSGPLKDTGTPTRPMTPEERTYFQGLVDALYDQFLSDVAQARQLPKEAVRKVADGRVLTGQQAMAAKLVDELGNFEDALEAAAKLAGGTGDPVPVFIKKRKGLLADLVEGGAESAAGVLKEQLVPGAAIELRDPWLR